MKTFIFNWEPIHQYQSIIRNVTIISEDAQQAMSCFISRFGNLKKNNINYIQQIDPITKENIDEPIIPQKENMLLPIKEKKI